MVDSITNPLGTEAHSSERLIRLDPCLFCYSPPSDAAEPSLPPLDAPLTFGSFNALSKISDLTIELWSEVMAAAPGSRLLLKAEVLADVAARRNLFARFALADPAGASRSPWAHPHYRGTLGPLFASPYCP